MPSSAPPERPDWTSRRPRSPPPPVADHHPHPSTAARPPGVHQVRVSVLLPLRRTPPGRIRRPSVIPGVAGRPPRARGVVCTARRGQERTRWPPVTAGPQRSPSCQLPIWAALRAVVDLDVAARQGIPDEVPDPQSTSKLGTTWLVTPTGSGVRTGWSTSALAAMASASVRRPVDGSTHRTRRAEPERFSRGGPRAVPAASGRGGRPRGSQGRRTRHRPGRTRAVRRP